LVRLFPAQKSAAVWVSSISLLLKRIRQKFGRVRGYEIPKQHEKTDHGENEDDGKKNISFDLTS